MNFESIIGAGTIGAILASIVTHILNKRKYNSEVETIMLDNVKQLMEMFGSATNSEKERRENCEAECQQMRQEIEELKREIAILKERSIVKN